MQTRLSAVAALLLGVLIQSNGLAADPPPVQLNLTVNTNGVKTVSWPRPLLPALETNLLSSGATVTGLLPVPPASVAVSPGGYVHTTSNQLPAQFFNLQLVQKSSNDLLVANVLNRLAYGPTPDELERITAMGADAYIEEQLNFEALAEPMDDVVAQSTNAVPPEAQTKTNWINVRFAGRVTSQRLYMYLTAPGEVYVDDVALYSGTGTNIDFSTNYVRNGDFESAFPGPWTVSANHAGSGLSSNVVCGGAASLRMAASSGGSTQGSSIWQDIAAGMTNNQPCTLSFSYLPRTNSGLLTIRLSNSGVIGAATNEPGPPTWLYATTTGTASSSTLYLYLNGAGEAYIDDIKLVAGSVPEAGANLVRNGDFEVPFPGTDWTVAPVASPSQVSTALSHSGNGSLHLVFTNTGSSVATAIVQTNLPVTQNATYTLSYWYIPSSNRRLTVRLSGSGIRSDPDLGSGALYYRLTSHTERASLTDLRAWFCQHSVGARRQLLEVLTQFLENHFVTQHSKSVDYLDGFYDDRNLMDRLAAGMEFREINRWRQALANPQGTFYDLLKISAESPAMIIYLDTVDSLGNGNNIANENYARELFELFCNGVDNGYDQNDIVAMSRAWTGWSVDILDPQNEFNPHAPRSTTYRVLNGNTSRSNLVGVWTFRYRPERHGTNREPIFPGKTIPARFGSPWAGAGYQLNIPPRLTGDTNSIQDGYDVIRHLANLPFTMEYLSVKLCRLFVHDNFLHGVYDYTDPNRSAEAELVRQCMLAWWNSNPRGQIRPVLRTIFNSELFRGHGGSMQKIKTPFEFVASSVRALRSANANGTFTASTDGASFATPLNRMGAMALFNRSDPDGYPEAGPPWISAGTLAERLRYIQSYLNATSGGGRTSDAGNNVCDPVALLKKKLPSGNWNDTGAVADYFLSILYPAEGKANLDLYRASAIAFLDTGDDGVTPSPFLSLSNTSGTYDLRVRGMVAMLMTFQRFQEQ
jgi:uncharacterized protein (DUF1800 family)